jgi:hypothetical protein
MEKLFQLKKKVVEELPSSLREPHTVELPEQLKKSFEKNKRPLSDEACVMASKEDGRWRVVDFKDENVFAYDLVREKEELIVFQPTASGFSDILFDYPIFEAGIPYVNEQGEEELMLISGMKRYYLNDIQKRKWDYFFRPFLPLVGFQHRLKILELSENSSKQKKALGKLKTLVYFLFAAAIASSVFIPMTEGASAIGTFLLLIIWIGKWMKFRKQRKDYLKKEKELESYEAELLHLEKQVPDEVPTDKEISDMYNEELSFLDVEAIESLGLDSETIMELDSEINPRKLKGITIEDWAYIQPESSVGKSSLRPEHMVGVVVGEDGQPRYAVYFVQFIYPTDDLITVYGCFYDFILRETKGLATDEYFYRNVVSVASKTHEEESFLDPKRVSETTLFRLTVSSGDSIQVALTDERLVDDMNRRFEAKSKLRRKRRQNVLLKEESIKKSGAKNKKHEASEQTQDDEYERLINVAESELPATRAKKAIAFIRRELRAKGRVDTIAG